MNKIKEYNDIKKVPISLIIDDPAPVISVYYEHAKNRVLPDGRTLLPRYPGDLYLRFCDIIERYGMKGKFSIVPMPGNKGSILSGIEGVSREEMTAWLDVAHRRIAPRFTIGPEMLSHNLAVNLETGLSLPIREDDFAKEQDRHTLTPYIARAISLLVEAGFDVFGVTSPWKFGIQNETEYEAAISRAVFEVTGKKNAWFFLRGLRDRPGARPWVALEEEGRTLVSIPATTSDSIWQTIACADTSEEYVFRVADELITADGTEGEILRVLDTDGYPILVTHWQSLMSNGLGTGLRVLEEIGRRIEKHLFDRVQWMSFAEIMEMVLADKAAYPKPVF